jgi:hypothetical protein
MYVPQAKNPAHYDDTITSYQIVEQHISDDIDCLPHQIPETRYTVLFSSHGPRMIWLMLRQLQNTQSWFKGLRVHVVQDGQLRGMALWHFMSMYTHDYMFQDVGKDCPYIEWIEVYELQGVTPVMTYTGAWYDVYRELSQWDPERTKRAWAKVMRQQRPLAEYNPPYIDFAYGSCANLLFDYAAWTEFQTGYDQEDDENPASWFDPNCDYGRMLESVARTWNRQWVPGKAA